MTITVTYLLYLTTQCNKISICGLISNYCNSKKTAIPCTKYNVSTSIYLTPFPEVCQLLRSYYLLYVACVGAYYYPFMTTLLS